jgi:ATP-dependent Lhr-like helicase
MRPERVVDPAGASNVPELHLDFVGTLDNAALLIERLYTGTRRLVFVDSRRRVEELGHRLSQRGVDVYLSHSSLALSERAAAERAFEEGTNCVIVATSALELGIDVGDLDHVIQIDAPSSVSSFLQRMGRTGRRSSSTANCTFLATNDDALLRAAAIIDLFRRGYVEPAAPSTWTPHVLAHQAIALSMQEQGSAAHGWWSWLEGCLATATSQQWSARASCAT